ncbi:MAG: DUF6502 family protein [Nevskiales bacterium]
MSADPAKAKLAAALRHLLRPLVRVMLRHGMAYGDFLDIVKATYAETAREDFALPGKKATDSRVAILTGLTRKEVKALREAAAGERYANANRATRVLSGWHQDPEFTGADGAPRPLPLDGEGSFADLVRRYSGDMPSRALLEELRRVNAVTLEGKDRVRVLSRAYVPRAGDLEGLRMLGTALHDLAATIDYNLTRSGAPARFQRTVFSERVPARVIPILSRITAERAQRFLESLDDWLTAHELGPRDKSKDEAVRTGVGIYFFQDPAPDGDKDDA